MATSLEPLPQLASHELLLGHDSNPRLRVLFIPFPVQGQINPMMHLAKTLTNDHAQQQLLHITFISPHYHHTQLVNKAHTGAKKKNPASTPAMEASRSISAKLKEEEEEEEREELRRRGFSKEVMLQPNIGSVSADNGLPYDFDYTKSADNMRVIVESCHVMSKNIKLFIKNEDQKVSFIVVGIFCDWAINVAADLGIPVVYFSTQAATVSSMYLHIPQLISHGFFNEETNFDYEENLELCMCQNGKSGLVTYIPGIPALPPSSFPTFMHVRDPSSPFVKFLETQCKKIMLCNAIIINTFEELEGDTCKTLESEFHMPVYPIGPVLPLHTTTTTTASEDENGCVAWLDTKPKHSVVYISFGSLCNPTAELIRGIAEGIKASKQPYLWALRPSSFSPSTSVRELLPEHFSEETDGLIVPWAPQLDVLSHSSIGAFLTHCGWNSTLESLSMGVPMIPIPVVMDQVTNCRLVVDIWKVGMNVKFALRSDGPVVNSEDVHRAVKLVIQEEEGHKMRTRAHKFMEIIRRATQRGGTSYAHLEDFVHYFKK